METWYEGNWYHRVEFHSHQLPAIPEIHSNDLDHLAKEPRPIVKDDELAFLCCRYLLFLRVILMKNKVCSHFVLLFLPSIGTIGTKKLHWSPWIWRHPMVVHSSETLFLTYYKVNRKNSMRGCPLDLSQFGGYFLQEKLLRSFFFAGRKGKCKGNDSLARSGPSKKSSWGLSFNDLNLHHLILPSLEKWYVDCIPSHLFHRICISCIFPFFLAFLVHSLPFLFHWTGLMIHVLLHNLFAFLLLDSSSASSLPLPFFASRWPLALLDSSNDLLGM